MESATYQEQRKKLKQTERIERQPAPVSEHFLRAAGPIQAKLYVGPASSAAEREADRVAAAFSGSKLLYYGSRGGSSSNVARESGSSETGNDSSRTVQRSAEMSKGRFTIPETFMGASPRGGGRLPSALSSSLGEKLGADFKDVRIHTDNHADALASSIGAKAFTLGKDVYFGKGQYAPETTAGRQLVAHELTHTIQQGSVVQRGGSIPVTQTASSGTVMRMPDFLGFKKRYHKAVDERMNNKEAFESRGKWARLKWAVSNPVASIKVNSVRESSELKTRMEAEARRQRKIFLDKAYAYNAGANPGLTYTTNTPAVRQASTSKGAPAKARGSSSTTYSSSSLPTSESPLHRQVRIGGMLGGKKQEKRLSKAEQGLSLLEPLEKFLEACGSAFDTASSAFDDFAAADPIGGGLSSLVGAKGAVTGIRDLYLQYKDGELDRQTVLTGIADIIMSLGDAASGLLNILQTIGPLYSAITAAVPVLNTVLGGLRTIKSGKEVYGSYKDYKSSQELQKELEARIDGAQTEQEREKLLNLAAIARMNKNSSKTGMVNAIGDTTIAATSTVSSAGVFSAAVGVPVAAAMEQVKEAGVSGLRTHYQHVDVKKTLGYEDMDSEIKKVLAEEPPAPTDMARYLDEAKKDACNQLGITDAAQIKKLHDLVEKEFKKPLESIEAKRIVIKRYGYASGKQTEAFLDNAGQRVAFLQNELAKEEVDEDVQKVARRLEIELDSGGGFDKETVYGKLGVSEEDAKDLPEAIRNMYRPGWAGEEFREQYADSFLGESITLLPASFQKENVAQIQAALDKIGAHKKEMAAKHFAAQRNARDLNLQYKQRPSDEVLKSKLVTELKRRRMYKKSALDAIKMEKNLQAMLEGIKKSDTDRLYLHDLQEITREVTIAQRSERFSHEGEGNTTQEVLGREIAKAQVLRDIYQQRSDALRQKQEAGTLEPHEEMMLRHLIGGLGTIRFKLLLFNNLLMGVNLTEEINRAKIPSLPFPLPEEKMELIRTLSPQIDLLIKKNQGACDFYMKMEAKAAGSKDAGANSETNSFSVLIRALQADTDALNKKKVIFDRHMMTQKNRKASPPSGGAKSEDPVAATV